jgi:hypothetical protein
MRWLLIPAALAVAVGTASGAEAPGSLFPFVLPWDDASPGVTDLAGWLTRPAGKLGPVRAGDDGHLYAGKGRIRFLGVNVCFDACFPRKDDADRVAGRLAKFGVNVVRFHHMDMRPFPQGLRARRGKGTAELDPEALDRLDTFIARLQDHGIYANLNLLVTRPLAAADGLPAEVERLDVKDRHVASFFFEPALKTQKDYARALLGHRNPYTGRTYAEDPGVAFVEINNENGLLHAWLGGQVDRLPAVFLRTLQGRWNDWLRQRYASADRLRQAWAEGATPPGAEMLANGSFTRGLEPWVLERHDRAEANAVAGGDVPEALRGGKSLAVTVTRPGSEAWHVQLVQRGLRLRAGQAYTLTFWAKADRPSHLSAGLKQAHEPWRVLSSEMELSLGKEWKPYRLVFVAGDSDEDARLNLTGLGREPGTVILAGVSLRPGGVAGLDPGEGPEDGSVAILPHARLGERTPARQRDWLHFLWETEDAYWQGMSRFLKGDLGVRAVVVGTIVGCSTPNLMARLDAVDTHAYWEHPQFPGRQWDEENWTVANRSMVNQKGGTLPGLALRRVLGKPHCVSEYNHPAPNTFGSEGFLLLAAYAALQDWDAVYAFAYSQRGDPDARRIAGFFDVDQHPTKMVTLPPAAALFVRGDVRPARLQVVRPLIRAAEVEALRSGHAWDLVHGGHAGIPWEAALRHRVSLMVEGGPRGETTAGDEPGEEKRLLRSDTGELAWDLRTKGRGVVTVDTPRSKAVIGYGGGRRFDLGGVVVEPGATAQDGWSAVTLTAVEGEDCRGPARLLVTATGYAQNTDMRWKTPAHDSVGRDWGRAPSLVEAVAARLSFPVSPRGVRFWALDERGRRGTPLPVLGGGGRAVVELGPQGKTLWYEIELK